MATAIGPNCEQQIVGVRPGEKIHEEMITSSDSYNTVDIGRYFAILPASAAFTLNEYCKEFSGEAVKPGFAYESGRNPDFLTVEQLRALLLEHVPAHSQA